MNTLETLERIRKELETAESERSSKITAIEAKKLPYLTAISEAEKTRESALTDTDPTAFDEAQTMLTKSRDALAFLDMKLEELKETTVIDLGTYQQYCSDIKSALRADTDTAAEKIRGYLLKIDAICSENSDLIQKGNELLSNLQNSIMFVPETKTLASGVSVLLPEDIQMFNDFSVASFNRFYEMSDVYNKVKE